MSKEEIECDVRPGTDSPCELCACGHCRHAHEKWRWGRLCRLCTPAAYNNDEDAPENEEDRHVPAAICGEPGVFYPEPGKSLPVTCDRERGHEGAHDAKDPAPGWAGVTWPNEERRTR